MSKADIQFRLSDQRHEKVVEPIPIRLRYAAGDPACRLDEFQKWLLSEGIIPNGCFSITLLNGMRAIVGEFIQKPGGGPIFNWEKNRVERQFRYISLKSLPPVLPVLPFWRSVS